MNKSLKIMVRLFGSEPCIYPSFKRKNKGSKWYYNPFPKNLPPENWILARPLTLSENVIISIHQSIYLRIKMH